MSLVRRNGDAGLGGGGRLVEYSTQRVEVHGLVAVPVELDRVVGVDRAAEFALGLPSEVHEAAQVERIGHQAAIGVGEGDAASLAAPPQFPIECPC